MKRWNHAHTLAAGAVFGVGLASREVWILCLLVFIAGILVGRFWGLVHWGAEALRLKVMHAKRATLHATPQPVYTGPDHVAKGSPFGKFPEGY